MAAFLAMRIKMGCLELDQVPESLKEEVQRILQE